MDIETAPPPAESRRAALGIPTLAWLSLCALTFAGIALGQLGGARADWLPLAVALIIWLKGTLVARYFIESGHAHPFIAWLLRVFIAFSPLALIATAYFGETLARWATL